jgi:hypothetical protein
MAGVSLNNNYINSDEEDYTSLETMSEIAVASTTRFWIVLIL